MSALSDHDLVAEIDRRIDRDNRDRKRPQGADVAAIVTAVAEENGVPVQHVKAICSEAWTALGRTG